MTLMGHACTLLFSAFFRVNEGVKRRPVICNWVVCWRVWKNADLSRLFVWSQNGDEGMKKKETKTIIMYMGIARKLRRGKKRKKLIWNKLPAGFQSSRRSLPGSDYVLRLDGTWNLRRRATFNETARGSILHLMILWKFQSFVRFQFVT